MAHNEQLIFDVGMHKGEDTEFYLEKGYRVVAFEANSSLAALCRQRFADNIRSGRLHIVEGAIAPPTGTGKVKFYVNKKLSIWGTIDEGWVARNDARGTESVEVEVDRIDMIEMFRKFGIPYFLKIDIEGADGWVLDALRAFEDRPQFVSVEANAVDVSATAKDLETLSQLGYRQFQLVPQRGIRGTLVDTKTLRGEALVHVFAEDASGLFGDELPGVWVDRDAVIGSLAPPFDEWQDIHASLSAPASTNVALHRPATQSSTSAWSTDPNPEVDARVANNGDTAAQTCFHTDVQVGPWWQVDLGELFFLEKIIIYNRSDHRERLRRFTVFGSVDGLKWVPLLKKADDSAFNVFAANIGKSQPARFVRVRLDGRDCLHFRQCQIFGTRAELAG